MREDDIGLKVTATFLEGNEMADWVLTLVKADGGKSMQGCFAFSNVTEKMKSDGNHIYKCSLDDVCLTLRGANPLTRLESVKSKALYDSLVREFEEIERMVKERESAPDPLLVEFKELDAQLSGTARVQDNTPSGYSCSNCGRFLPAMEKKPAWYGYDHAVCTGCGTVNFSPSDTKGLSFAALEDEVQRITNPDGWKKFHAEVQARRYKRQLKELSDRHVAKQAKDIADRESLPDSRFVFPEERKFPIDKPERVMAAVNSWGRYRGRRSFEEFRSRLSALCHRLGEEYVRELPESWTEGKSYLAEINALAKSIDLSEEDFEFAKRARETDRQLEEAQRRIAERIRP